LSGCQKVYHKLGESLCAFVLPHSNPISISRFLHRLHTKLRGLREAFLVASLRGEAFAQSRAATNLAITPQRDHYGQICRKPPGGLARPELKVRTCDGQEDEAVWLASQHGSAVSRASLCRLLSTAIVRDDDDGAFDVHAAEMCRSLLTEAVNIERNTTRCPVRRVGSKPCKRMLSAWLKRGGYVKSTGTKKATARTRREARSSGDQCRRGVMRSWL
jgi:hypothetical protein